MHSTAGTTISALNAVCLGLELAFFSQSGGSVLGGLFSHWLKTATSSTYPQLKQPAAAVVRERESSAWVARDNNKLENAVPVVIEGLENNNR